MPDLCVISARPVSVSRNGKVKARKRKRNDLSVLSVVPGLYPGGAGKLAKDANTDPFKRKKKRNMKRYGRLDPGWVAMSGSVRAEYNKEKREHAKALKRLRAQAKLDRNALSTGRKANKKRAAPRKKRRTVKAKANRKTAKRKRAVSRKLRRKNPITKTEQAKLKKLKAAYDRAYKHGTNVTLQNSQVALERYEQMLQRKLNAEWGKR